MNDEVARLYKDSPRAVSDHPSLLTLTRYSVALARYLQNPMKEYAALGEDVISLAFHPCQHLLPQDKLAKHLETAMVDMVNLCGVDINEAANDAYTAKLLPFVAGLGPRKATAVLKGIAANGGILTSRDELVGTLIGAKLQVVGPRVWNNCASFLFIEYDSSNPSSDPLDNTRVHPEDYELGRKMAGDALELDEEDVQVETDEGGQAAVVRKLFKEEEQEKSQRAHPRGVRRAAGAELQPAEAGDARDDPCRAAGALRRAAPELRPSSAPTRSLPCSPARPRSRSARV